MRNLRPFLPLLLLVICCATHAQTWVEVRSNNFIVDTDAGDSRGREVALRFEQMRASFGSLLGKEKISDGLPLGILLFRDPAGLQNVAPMQNGASQYVDGIFLKGSDKDYIAVDATPNPAWQPIWHAYAHTLLNANFPPSQLWFDEGFAEYFSAIRIDKKSVYMGAPPEGALQVLKNGLMPVQQLLAADKSSKDYNEDSDHHSLFYAQSWLMVHYLYEEQKLGAASSYFDLVLNQKVPLLQAFQQAFHMTPAQFDVALKDHLAKIKDVSFKWPLPDSPDPVMYSSKKLKPNDVNILLADVHMHDPSHFEQSIAEFESALQSDPASAEANRGLGYAYLQKGDSAKALDYFTKAAVRGSVDPRVHYFVAKARFDKGSGRDLDAEDLVQIAQDLNEAIKLDPSFADAFDLRGAVMDKAGDSSKSIIAYKEAVRLRPRDDQFKLDLGNEYLAAEKFDDAIAVFNQLAQSSDNALAGAAKKLSETARARKADPLLRIAALNEKSLVSPQWQPKPGTPAASDLTKMENQQRGIETPDPRPVKFVTGRLLSLDCSKPPRALLVVRDANGKIFKLSAASTAKIVIIGSEEFSCAWKNRRVSVNYRATTLRAGDVVSVELH